MSSPIIILVKFDINDIYKFEDCSGIFKLSSDLYQKSTMFRDYFVNKALKIQLLENFGCEKYFKDSMKS